MKQEFFKVIRHTMTNNIGSFLLGLASLGAVAANLQTTPSPLADTDLICPTESSADCYPKLFQPTENFQLIREGQDLPPGLHVRMNIWTGEKEARLNIPLEGDTEQQLDGLPTEQSVVVVEKPAEDVVDEKPALRDQVPQKPPSYEDAGKIVPPPDGDEVGDSETLRRAIHSLDAMHSQAALDLALSDLSDLAHDIYYGVELTKQPDTFERLLDLMSSKKAHHRRQAALILGKSIHNNPTALKGAQDAWSLLSTSSHKTLITKVQQSLSSENNPAATRAQIHFLSGLAKSPGMRDAFVADKGLDLLLSIFIKEGAEWDSVRVQISNFVMDTFLDEDMGAEMGVWPRTKATLDGEGCQPGEDSRTGEGCWEWHLERMGWSDDMPRLGEFLKLLKERRPVEGTESGRRQIGTHVDREL